MQTTNRILAGLRPVEFARLSAFLTPVNLKSGAVLFEPGQLIQHVYFPESALISLLAGVDGSHTLEVGMMGSEGVLGCTLALGENTLSVRASVYRSGWALRMRACHFLDACRLGQPLYQSVNRCIHALMQQMAQISVCNRFHDIESRLARWLLMTRDRGVPEHFELTQALLSYRLGVRRAGVTDAAQALKRRGLINYRRAWVEITNEAGLEAASCSCYQQLRVEVVGSARDRPYCPIVRGHGSL
jgi:CRP-like cAMP-binding protein